MIGIRIRARARHACGHHWHVVETGWRCCGCPGRVKAAGSPPEPGTAACRAGEPAGDRITEWLADPRPDRAGGRASRFPYRRLRAL